MRNGVLLCLGILSGSAFADFNNVDFAKFATLDAKFEQRETLTTADAKATISGYEKMFPTLSGDNLFYAVGQANKLSLYYGDYVVGKANDADKQERQDVFSACVKRTEAISPSKMTGAFKADVYANQYYYWRMACLALQAEFANILVKGDLALTLIRIRDSDLKIIANKVTDASGNVSYNITHSAGNACYQGGGIFRTMAGILSNPVAKSVGLYQPDQALSYADYALTYKADFNNYCELDAYNVISNYKYKADALVQLGKDAEALAVTKTSICRFLADAKGNCNIKAPLGTADVFAAIDADPDLATTLPEARGDMARVIDIFNKVSK